MILDEDDVGGRLPLQNVFEARVEDREWMPIRDAGGWDERVHLLPFTDTHQRPGFPRVREERIRLSEHADGFDRRLVRVVDEALETHVEVAHLRAAHRLR